MFTSTFAFKPSSRESPRGASQPILVTRAVFQGRIKHKQLPCAGLGRKSPERLRLVGENKQEAFARLLCPAVSVREETANKTGSLGWGYKNSLRLKKSHLKGILLINST